MATNSRWSEVVKKYPDASASAQLLMSERAELKDLNKLKRFPTNCIRMLEESIKERADFLIQTGVTGLGRA